MPDPRSAIVLLSGGIDSTTTLALAKATGYRPYALSFHYGQRHAYELIAAGRVAEQLGVADHKVLQVDMRMFGGSSLTGDLPLPTGRSVTALNSGSPSTYVPARNTIFLAFALAWAEVLGASDIFLGVNALDYAGYPDCRPEYLHAFEQMANLATRSGVSGQTRLTLHAPLIQLTKGEIIRRGYALGVDYSLTSTCYDPDIDGLACGQCDACVLRLQGFADSNLPDPIQYRAAHGS